MLNMPVVFDKKGNIDLIAMYAQYPKEQVDNFLVGIMQDDPRYTRCRILKEQVRNITQNPETKSFLDILSYDQEHFFIWKKQNVLDIPAMIETS